MLLMLLACLVAMNMVLSSITNAASTAYQQIIFERNMGFDLDAVLHLDYQDSEETSEFTDVLAQYRTYIASLDGVTAVGMQDVAGVNFSELASCVEYQTIHAEIVAGNIYET